MSEKKTINMEQFTHNKKCKCDTKYIMQCKYCERVICSNCLQVECDMCKTIICYYCCKQYIYSNDTSILCVPCFKL